MGRRLRDQRGGGGCNMTASDTPNSATEQKRAERLDVSHARAVQDPVEVKAGGRGRYEVISEASCLGRRSSRRINLPR